LGSQDVDVVVDGDGDGDEITGKAWSASQRPEPETWVACRGCSSWMLPIVAVAVAVNHHVNEKERPQSAGLVR